MTDSAVTYSTSSNADPQVVAVILFALMLGLAAVVILYAIPFLVALWKLFAKAGRPGWAAIVPFYNMWVFNEIGHGEQWKFWAYLGGCLLAAIPGVGPLLGLAALALYIVMIVAFAKQFDRSAGFWVLLYLLPIIGVFMVGKAKYVENATPFAASAPAVPTAPAATSTPAGNPPTDPHSAA